MPLFTNVMRIFIPPEDIAKKQAIKLNADKSHYLISVMRCKTGDAFEVIDGVGLSYRAEIDSIVKKQVFINIVQENIDARELPSNLILCAGILKGEKMDISVQKAAELGVREIRPFISERCVVKETRKTTRWQKIAEESAEQCGSSVIPIIREPVKFKSLFESCNRLNGFIFWEEGGMPLIEAFKKTLAVYKSGAPPIYIFVGPEGGFTLEEVAAAEKCGIIRTTLGRRILRAETAAIVSTALLQFLIENG